MIAAVTQTIYLCPIVTRFVLVRVTRACCWVWISIPFRGPKGRASSHHRNVGARVPERMALPYDFVAGVEEGESISGRGDLHDS